MTIRLLIGFGIELGSRRRRVELVEDLGGRPVDEVATPTSFG